MFFATPSYVNCGCKESPKSRDMPRNLERFGATVGRTTKTIAVILVNEQNSGEPVDMGEVIQCIPTSYLNVFKPTVIFWANN